MVREFRTGGIRARRTRAAPSPLANFSETLVQGVSLWTKVQKDRELLRQKEEVEENKRVITNLNRTYERFEASELEKLQKQATSGKPQTYEFLVDMVTKAYKAYSQHPKNKGIVQTLSTEYQDMLSDLIHDTAKILKHQSSSHYAKQADNIKSAQNNFLFTKVEGSLRNAEIHDAIREKYERGKDIRPSILRFLNATIKPVLQDSKYYQNLEDKSLVQIHLGTLLHNAASQKYREVVQDYLSFEDTVLLKGVEAEFSNKIQTISEQLKGEIDRGELKSARQVHERFDELYGERSSYTGRMSDVIHTIEGDMRLRAINRMVNYTIAKNEQRIKQQTFQENRTFYESTIENITDIMKEDIRHEDKISSVKASLEAIQDKRTSFMKDPYYIHLSPQEKDSYKRLHLKSYEQGLSAAMVHLSPKQSDETFGDEVKDDPELLTRYQQVREAIIKEREANSILFARDKGLLPVLQQPVTYGEGENALTEYFDFIPANVLKPYYDSLNIRRHKQQYLLPKTRENLNDEKIENRKYMHAVNIIEKMYPYENDTDVNNFLVRRGAINELNLPKDFKAVVLYFDTSSSVVQKSLKGLELLKGTSISSVLRDYDISVQEEGDIYGHSIREYMEVLKIEGIEDVENPAPVSELVAGLLYYYAETLPFPTANISEKRQHVVQEATNDLKGLGTPVLGSRGGLLIPPQFEHTKNFMRDLVEGTVFGKTYLMETILTKFDIIPKVISSTEEPTEEPTESKIPDQQQKDYFLANHYIKSSANGEGIDIMVKLNNKIYGVLDQEDNQISLSWEQIEKIIQSPKPQTTQQQTDQPQTDPWFQGQGQGLVNQTQYKGN